jgi:nucleotide-binding universal stress UspA family protein
MFKNVVLTTDLSSNADAAIPYAAALTRRDGGTIHLFHAFEDHAGQALVSGVLIGVSAWQDSIHKQCREKLTALAEKIELEFHVKTVFATAKGHAANEATRYAKQNHADLIVVSTHGRTGVSHLMMGSTAERIVRLSEPPVLTIHPGEALVTGKFQIHTVMLPTDFSENAAAAEPYALTLAKQHRAKLVLVHVVDDSSYSNADPSFAMFDVEKWLEESLAEAEKRLSETAANLSAKSGLHVDVILKRGRATEQLGIIAKECADLIVISTHGYTGISHLVLGSVAERVIRTSPVPVLSIKPSKVVSG